MFTMANIAAFHLLYTCAILSLCQQHSGQHWTLNKHSSSRSQPIQLSGDCPLLSIARWHTNNPSITIPTCPHAPKNISTKTHSLAIYCQADVQTLWWHCILFKYQKQSIIPSAIFIHFLQFQHRNWYPNRNHNQSRSQF